ncbi:hypothetical protein ACLOJK_033991 [Asimina triloba]
MGASGAGASMHGKFRVVTENASLSLLEEALKHVDSSDPAVISFIIDEYAGKPVLKEDSAYRRLDVIDKCLSKGSVEGILSALEAEVASRKDKPDVWIPQIGNIRNFVAIFAHNPILQSPKKDTIAVYTDFLYLLMSAHDVIRAEKEGGKTSASA